MTVSTRTRVPAPTGRHSALARLSASRATSSPGTTGDRDRCSAGRRPAERVRRPVLERRRRRAPVPARSPGPVPAGREERDDAARQRVHRRGRHRRGHRRPGQRRQAAAPVRRRFHDRPAGSSPDLGTGADLHPGSRGRPRTPRQVNAYVTPAQNTGFSDHYDVHDVFVLQVAGEKRWRIREPVHPSPLRDQPWTDRRSESSRPPRVHRCWRRRSGRATASTCPAGTCTRRAPSATSAPT